MSNFLIIDAVIIIFFPSLTERKLKIDKLGEIL